MSELYRKDPMSWNKKSLNNIAAAGLFLRRPQRTRVRKKYLEFEADRQMIAIRMPRATAGVSG